jgi:Leucine-rich repeat (LRR) protein
VTSDLSEQIRPTAAKVIINNFLEEGENLLKLIFKHEQSCDCLLGIYNALTNKKSASIKDLLLLMEETIGKKYLIYYDLLPKEAMALELLGRHLCKLYVFHDLTEWIFRNLKIKSQRVVSIEINNLHNSINSKFFSLFSGLQELKLIDCKLNDALYLTEILSLRITGTEEGQLDSIDDIEGFENLINLRNLDLSTNYISEMTKLEKLVNLVNLDLSQNEISEIKGLENLNNLEVLNLEWNNIREIKNLENLVSLRELNLSDNKEIPEIKGLRKLKNLEILRLFNNYMVNEIKELEGLNNLKILDISKDSAMIDFDVIKEFLTWKSPFKDGIDVKEIIKNNKIINERYDEYRKKLKKYRDYIKEIKGLDTLTNLEELFLEGNSITEIKGLEKLKNLNVLNLSGNKITEIKGLENLKKLKKLILVDNQIIPIKGLEGLEGLENDLGVYEPQKFVDYCLKKKMRYLLNIYDMRFFKNNDDNRRDDYNSVNRR